MVKKTLNVCIIIITVIFICGCSVADADILSNTSGNIVNYGQMVKCKNKIYYISKDYINVMDLDGKNQKQICKGVYYRLNTAGDYVYFLEYTDRLYKIKYGETELIPVNSNRRYANFFIYNNWIYYTDDFTKDLYKTDLTCKNDYLLSEGEYTNVTASKGWIYADNLIEDTVGDGENPEIYKVICRISTDGKKKENLGEDKLSATSASYLNITQDCIYYTDGNHSLCKMSLDGKNKKVLSKDKFGDINVSKDWVYFRNLSDNGSLYKMKIDGSNKKKLTDNAQYINIIDDLIV
jgi:hypothetical protein